MMSAAVALAPSSLPSSVEKMLLAGVIAPSPKPPGVDAPETEELLEEACRGRGTT